MDIQTKIGQLFIFTLTDLLRGGWRHQREILRRYRPGGFIVNPLKQLGNRREVAGYISRLQEMAASLGLPGPLIICVDHRGGDSSILLPSAGGLEFPAPIAMAAIADDPERVSEEIGAAIARDVLDVGFNLNLAPYADVLEKGNIEKFAFGNSMMGSDPNVNAALAVGLNRGMQREGLRTTYCVFPGGYGSLDKDPHHFPGIIDADRETIEELHLHAARVTIAAGVDSVMLSHFQYPALDPRSLPATYSPAIIQDLLRGDLGFEGMVMTDAINMRGAIDVAGSRGEAAVRAIEAGADTVLFSNWGDHKAVEDAVMSGRIPESRLDEAVERVLDLKKKLVSKAPGEKVSADPVDTGTMTYWIGRSVTWYRRPNDWRSLSALRGRRGRLVAVGGIGAFLDAAGEVGGDFVSLVFLPNTTWLNPEPQETTFQTLLQRTDPGDLVVFGTSTADDIRMAKRLARADRDVWIVHLGRVFDVREAVDMPVVLLAYSHQPVACRKAFEALFGLMDASGRLPDFL